MSGCVRLGTLSMGVGYISTQGRERDEMYIHRGQQYIREPKETHLDGMRLVTLGSYFIV